MWPCYRLIAHGWAKLEELQRSWSVEDVYRANDALDSWLDAQSRAMPKE